MINLSETEAFLVLRALELAECERMDCAAIERDHDDDQEYISELEDEIAEISKFRDEIARRIGEAQKAGT